MSIPISKTLDEVRDDLFTRIAAVQQDGWLPGSLSLNKGVVRGMIELWAWGLYQLYAFLGAVLAQAFPESATGVWLDLHCRQVGVERIAATKAYGVVVFGRAGTSGNVNIPAGRLLKTKTDGLGLVYRYVTLVDAVLADGASEVSVAVEAEEYGTAPNAVSGQICEISTVIPGIDYVTNSSDWLSSAGVDVEDDDKLRQRYQLAWSEVNGSTKYAYESWARGVTGVIAVAIMDNHPRGQGTVDVVVRGASGLPTAELLAAVDGVVQANRPINDDVLVRGPGVVDVVIDAEIEVVGGDSAVIIAEVTARLTALFNDPSGVAGIVPLGIGDDLTVDRLVAECMAVIGVKKINWLSPGGDLLVADDELAVLQSLSLTAKTVQV